RPHHLHAALAKVPSERGRKGEGDDERVGNPREESPRQERDGDAGGEEAGDENVAAGAGPGGVPRGGGGGGRPRRGRGRRAQRGTDLRANDEERGSGDEALGDRGGDRPDEEAQPGGGEQEDEGADHQRQGGGELDVGGSEGLGEVVQRAQHQDSHDADRPGEQQAVAAEGDCQGGSGAAGVEAVDGRNAGYDGVGHG